MADPLRVGLIGVGWGALVHAPAFKAAAGYEPVALCSRRRESLEAAGARTGITDLSADWKDFVRRDDLDMISISSPVDLHREMTLAAVAAGKRVLCEKPAALTPADAREMYDAAEAAGVAHATCFELRWLPERLAVWDAVRAGLVGKAYNMRLLQSADYWHPTHGPQSEWMYRKDQGGGYLMGMLSHDIDYACTLLGEPEAVAADVRTNTPRRKLADGREIEVDADDTTVVLIRFKGGASAVISCSVVGAHAAGVRMDLFGEDGTVLFESGPQGRKVTGGAARAEGLSEMPLAEREPKGGPVTAKGRSAGMIRATALLLETWQDNLADPEAAIPTLRAGWRAMQVIDAARRSAAGEGWVGLD